MQFASSGRRLVSGLFVFFFTAALSLAGAQTETTLHTFTNGSDGGYPQSSALLSLGGKLYGVSLFGGLYSYGTVFELENINGRWQEIILYNFTGGSDGGYPIGALIPDASGNLYGVTTNGGPQNSGVVFELVNSGGSWQEQVLHSFGSNFDGANPQGPLVFDSKGNLFGTTVLGGGLNEGTVYEMTNSNGSWDETVIHNFGGTGDGTLPYGQVVLDAAGNVYGTTATGGPYQCTGLGCGIVYELSPSSSGWTETIVHSFQGSSDGFYPRPLTRGKNGTLFGATAYGGYGSCSNGCGTVFELAQSENGTWTKTVLHRFVGGTSSGQPSAPVTLDRSGNIYGETGQQGSSYGTVYRLAPKTGGGYAFRLLLNFNGTDGANPEGGVILGPGGTIYGTTIYGGPYNAGVAFSLRP